MVILATCKNANDKRSMLYISIFLKKSQNFSILAGFSTVGGRGGDPRPLKIFFGEIPPPHEIRNPPPHKIEN